jgi:hypothetical protein
MTEERLPLQELLARAGDADFLRRVAEAVLQGLMKADVKGLIGAGRYERSGELLNWRNGYALARWEALTLPRRRQGRAGQQLGRARQPPAPPGQEEPAVRRVGCGRPSRRGHRVSHRHRQAQRPRPGSLPARRARTHRRSPRQPRGRTAALDTHADRRNAHRLAARSCRDPLMASGAPHGTAAAREPAHR